MSDRIDFRPRKAGSRNAQAVPSAIVVRNLRKTFGSGSKAVTAVDGVSFAVKKGEIFAFLGPNGAGKSTTIKMLTTLLSPSAGAIRVAGFDPRTHPDEVRRRFGIVFQDPSVDDELTAFENMEFHGALYGVPNGTLRPRILDLLAFVGLLERRDDLVKTFSGGMRRRLEIARALLHHPDILFLDEPTLGLDPQTRNHLWQYIRKMNREQGTTIFLTTHYLEEAEKMADRIAVIDRGKIVAEGTPATLKRQTKTRSLEEAFIALTGHAIRNESADAGHLMRLWHGGRRR
ncbi:MAG: ATP-binding cassette domain-containing protein [Candidatus Micrarchaeota archaeon]|nr:ATP-binding cassette domain-containing protein [Candidatus Micrarchaeota archaeon]